MCSKRFCSCEPFLYKKLKVTEVPSTGSQPVAIVRAYNIAARHFVQWVSVIYT